MYYFIALITFLIDRLSKLAVVKWMQEGQTIPLWEGVFHITSLRNKGAAFGILQGQRWLFIILTVIVISGIVFYLRQNSKKNPRMSLALSILLGGALGNFYDRLIKGEVVDSLDFRLIDYPIFNLADVFIFTGVALLLWEIWQEDRKSKKESV